MAREKKEKVQKWKKNGVTCLDLLKSHLFWVGSADIFRGGGGAPGKGGGPESNIYEHGRYSRTDTCMI